MNTINPVISVMNSNDIYKIIELQKNNNNNILSENSIISDIQNNTSIYFVAKIDKYIIGYIAADILYDHLDISSVLVDINYTRKGIAYTLLSYVIDYAKKNNIPEIFLEVRTSNIPAQKLYEKFNFLKINIRKNYYADNLEDAIIYKLSI